MKQVVVADIHVSPKCPPQLRPDSVPAWLWDRGFHKVVAATGRSTPIRLGLEREDGKISVYETRIFDPEKDRAGTNEQHLRGLVEGGLVPLWGCWRIWVGGPPQVGEFIQRLFPANDPGQTRAFSADWLGGVYGQRFEVRPVTFDEVPPANERLIMISAGGKSDELGLGLDIGRTNFRPALWGPDGLVHSFSRRYELDKVANPGVYFRVFATALREVLAHTPQDGKVRGLVVSSAGMTRGDRAVVKASWLRQIPPEHFQALLDLFPAVAQDLRIPEVRVINDGKIGTTSVIFGTFRASEDGGVIFNSLGNDVALGVGRYEKGVLYLDTKPDEGAFVVSDYSPSAFIREWTGLRGQAGEDVPQFGALNFARVAGIPLDPKLEKREQLIALQEMRERGNETAVLVNVSMGRCLGYFTLRLSDFYPDLRYFIFAGQVVKGEFGETMIEECQRVWRAEAPELTRDWQVHLPSGDEEREMLQAELAAQLARMMD